MKDAQQVLIGFVGGLFILGTTAAALASDSPSPLPTKSFIYKKTQAGRPGDRRPLPARLEGNGQAAGHRVLLRRRLDQRHDQGSSSPRQFILPAGAWSPHGPTIG